MHNDDDRDDVDDGRLRWKLTNPMVRRRHVETDDLRPAVEQILGFWGSFSEGPFAGVKLYVWYF